eukprot:2358174-Pleurochrysis_carterae.AAC.2
MGPVEHALQLGDLCLQTGATLSLEASRSTDGGGLHLLDVAPVRHARLLSCCCCTLLLRLLLLLA